ncbi:rhodanese-like domain-containing protein [Bdellovibrio bacteriovorus]|nr:rhodanese-like domain-containing protein [Bdellovibrio bacteriovorus]AHZ86176.1 hypothetical protein EP01_14720 [Bdellovibrio bacteriovorus]BEV67412.1 Thiosulfate sulfurtransferase PspE [Bdellovibrio bacteriovorus]
MKKKIGLFLIFVGSLVSSSALAKEVLLDVRTPDEYSQSYLPGAINIDVLDKNFRTRVSELNRDDGYKVYCRSGKRATQAVTVMRELGFKTVTNLGGYEEAQRRLNLKPVHPK